MHKNWRAPIKLIVASLTAIPFLVAVTPASADDLVPSTVKINEVESNGGTPGDWVELVNTGAAPVDVSGWVVKDNDDTHAFTVAAGTTVAAGAFLALDVDPVFGLGGADSARLFLPDATTLVDSYSWTAHAATTYGRCPDGTGTFVDHHDADQGRGERVSRSGFRLALAGRRGGGHRRRRQHVRHQHERPGLRGVRRRDARCALGGEERSRHAVPPGVERYQVDTRHDRRLERRQGAALPGRHRRSRLRGRDPDRSRSGRRCVRLDRTQQRQQRRQPARGAALRPAWYGDQPDRHEGVEPHRGPAGGGREQRAGGDLLDPRLVPDLARLPRRAHRRGL